MVNKSGKKIKILHIVNSLNVGGLENVLVNIINNSDVEKYQHSICCMDTVGPMASRITRKVEIFSLGKGSSASYLLAFKAAKVIGKVGPDIVHSRNWSSIDGVIGALLARTRFIVHDERGRDAADPTGANKRRKLIRRLLSPFITRFVTVSSDLAGWLVNEVGVAPGKVSQIPNGVDTCRFSPSHAKAHHKGLLGLAADTFVIGTVGRLDPVKDFSTLLNAVALLHVDAPPTGKIHLVLAGGGPEEGLLKELAAQLQIAHLVSFLGERTDIPDILKSFDLFVLSSIAEGIPNTVLEAMSTAVAVVATNVGGVSEVVSDGVTGFLVPPGSPGAIADKIRAYAACPELLEAHGCQARAQAVDRFSLQAMVRTYEQLYDSLPQSPSRN